MFNYTDWHNVDEDLTAIAEYGGQWNIESYAGITDRHVASRPTAALTSVASKHK